MDFFLEKTPLQVQRELAKKIKAIRKGRKMSQADMASRSGISLGTIKRFESTGQISVSSLLALAHIFNRLDDFDLVFEIDKNAEAIKKLFP